MSTPAEHYREAERLIAKLEQTDPNVWRSLALVQQQATLATLHATLATVPPWLLSDEPDGVVDAVVHCDTCHDPRCGETPLGPALAVHPPLVSPVVDGWPQRTPPVAAVETRTTTGGRL